MKKAIIVLWMLSGVITGTKEEKRTKERLAPPTVSNSDDHKKCKPCCCELAFKLCKHPCHEMAGVKTLAEAKKILLGLAVNQLKKDGDASKYFMEALRIDALKELPKAQDLLSVFCLNACLPDTPHKHSE